MSLPIILIVGSLNTDLVTNTPRVPDAGETIQANSFATHFGGKGANQAIACARLSRLKTPQGIITAPSTYVRMVGCVGNDDFGNSLKNSLKSDGIDVDGVEVQSGVPSGVAVILLEIPLDSVLEQLQLASEASPPIPTLLNPAPATRLPDNAYSRITHLILNETEAVILGGGEPVRTESEANIKEDCHKLSQNFVKKGVMGSVVITLGSKGAFLFDVRSGKNSLVPAEDVQVVDTTAAGDTFVGGLYRNATPELSSVTVGLKIANLKAL
ncbi:Ribokinase [Arthrobotrys entomopaga]|nr:Ribokinase [Arthrobotrys entomopaga]